jgi:hypothetical protein
MTPEAKVWVKERITEDDSESMVPTKESFAFRLWLGEQWIQEKQLDVCHGLDPYRPSPFGN